MRRCGHSEKIHQTSSENPHSTQLERPQSEQDHNSERIDQTSNGVLPHPRHLERPKSELNHDSERIHQTNNDVLPHPRHLERPTSRILPAYCAPENWPDWLIAAFGNPTEFWSFRCSDSFKKLYKVGQGTYSNVFKAIDRFTGKIVALKKVRLNSLERVDNIEFMIREIRILAKLDHDNVIKLEGLAASRASDESLYLIFQYMEHDLDRLPACPDVKFTEPQIKCYMKQLLSGLEYCHNQGVLHRDIKCGNLLVDDEGNLKIADFGLATFYDPNHQRPMTNKVVTIWYRPPELLLGATHYGVGVDLWSVGCILGELLIGRPLLQGLTEVEQLHQIYKLCGPPSEEYWQKYKFPKNTIINSRQTYRRCIAETFESFPPATIALIETLLSIDPDERGTATDALNSDFFTTEPYACEPSSLPKYPSTESFNKRRIEAAERQKILKGKGKSKAIKTKVRADDWGGQAIPSTSSAFDQKATDIVYSDCPINPAYYQKATDSTSVYSDRPRNPAYFDQKATDIVYSDGSRSSAYFDWPSNRWADDTILGAKNKGKAEASDSDW